MADIPVPTNVTLTEDGDSVFEDVYIYGNLYYDFGSDDLTFNTLNVTGKSTLGDLTVNNFNVSVDAKMFLKHINEFHHSGVSVHEERGHYFTVDDNFRKMLDKKINDND